MKTHLFGLSVLAAAMAVGSYAQGSIPVTANVPFDFIAGSRTFHAGQYTVREGPARGLIEVRSENGAVSAMAIGIGLESGFATTHPRLVFLRYGNTYFLSQVWGFGREGEELLQSRRERELTARRLTPENVVLRASR